MPSWIQRTARAALLLAIAAGAARAEDAKPSDVSPATEEMLKSMRERGIITQEVYEDAYRREAVYQATQRAKEALPGWMQGWTVGGDLRIRYDRQDWGDDLGPGQVFVVGDDNIDTDAPAGGTGRGFGERDRLLLRVRLGVEKQLGEQFQVGVRIGTAAATDFGSNIGFNGNQDTFNRVIAANSRSGNVELGDYFSGKPIWLDRGYVRYTPFFAKTFHLVGGKIPNPFHSGRNPAENLVWDPDINPDGFSAQYAFDFVPDRLWLDAAAGYFILDEIGNVTIDVPPAQSVTIAPNYDDGDPSMWGAQLGLTGRPVDWLSANARVAYYDLFHLDTGFVAYANDTGNGGDAVDGDPLLVLVGPANPLFTSGTSRGRLKQLTADGFLSFTPFGERYRIQPFFLWSKILTASSENQAWAAGVELGDRDLLKLSFLYGQVERNGTVGIFTDSEIFDGFTNVEGWYAAIERSLTEHVYLRAVYSRSKIEEETCAIAASGKPELCDTAFALFPDRLAQFRKTQRDRTRWQVDLNVEF